MKRPRGVCLVLASYRKESLIILVLSLLALPCERKVFVGVAGKGGLQGPPVTPYTYKTPSYTYKNSFGLLCV